MGHGHFPVALMESLVQSSGIVQVVFQVVLERRLYRSPSRFPVVFQSFSSRVSVVFQSLSGIGHNWPSCFQSFSQPLSRSAKSFSSRSRVSAKSFSGSGHSLSQSFSQSFLGVGHLVFKVVFTVVLELWLHHFQQWSPPLLWKFALIL